MCSLKLFEKQCACGKLFLLLLVFALIFLIGWVRLLTGPEFAFSILYLLPIITVTWLCGMAWGILAALVSVFSWFLADLSMLDRFSNAYIPLVNECLRLMVFLFIVWLITRYKTILAAQNELAMTDPLTGIANRRAFFQFARIELDRSRRYHHPFSVMVIDIDNFKLINDNFGHQTGDQLLKKVVETIRHHVRAIDIVSRFGGDEFVVLLVRTGEEAAGRIAKKLQKQLLDIMQENQWGVTFSIGVATCLSVPVSIDEMVKAADQLMYEVKHNGKNSISQAVINTSSK